jgi:outer membrane protein assembly factor BamB
MSARRVATVLVAAFGLLQEPREFPNASEPPVLSWHVAGEGRGRPDIDGTSVFFLSSANDVVAIDRWRGHVRWRAPIGPRPSADLLTLGPRVVVSGPVVVGGGQTLVALDRATGARRWETAPPRDHGLGLYLGDSIDGELFAGSASGALVAVDAWTGATKWRLPVSGPRTTVYAPAVAGADVAAIFRNFDVRDEAGVVVVERGGGVEKWRRRLPPSADHPFGAPPAGGPVADDASWFVSGHDGRLHALSRASGELRWSTAPGPAPDYRPLVVAGSVVVAGSLSGEVTAYDRNTGDERWKVKPDWASVAFEMAAGGDIVFAPYLSGETFGFAVGDGRIVWRSGSVGRGFRYSPRVAGGQVYLSSLVSGFFSVPAGL